MKILLANPRGFCAGVDRAIEIVNVCLERFEPPIYVRHEVVHNKFVVEFMLSNGLDVILEIDWQGALQVQKLRPDATTIFILPPDRQSLRQRLSNRGQDSQEVIERRLAGSVNEMSQYVNFDYVVINDNFDVALAELKSIIIANRLTLAKQQERHAGRIEQLLSE
jgi:guanylate kinase